LESYGKVLEDAYSNSKKETAIYNRMWLDSPWSGFFDRSDPMKLPSTGIHEETLQHIAKVFSTEPGGEMTLHSGELNGYMFYVLLMKQTVQSIDQLSQGLLSHWTQNRSYMTLAVQQEVLLT